MLFLAQSRHLIEQARKAFRREVAEVTPVSHALELAQFEGGVDHSPGLEGGGHLGQQRQQLPVGDMQDRRAGSDAVVDRLGAQLLESHAAHRQARELGGDPAELGALRGAKDIQTVVRLLQKHIGGVMKKGRDSDG